MTKQEIKFHSDSIFAGQTGIIDRDNSIIRGVSVITGNQTAEGHDLYVDDTTLRQLQECAKAKGKIPVSLDHGSGVKDLNGYLTSFRMDGDKLRADWHLLKHHGETPLMLERAETMPDCFGMSTAFRPPNGNMKGVPIGDGKMAARCEKLLSVDCVTRPAANEGLFSVKEVDNNKKGNMADQSDTNPQEPTLTEIVEAIREISGRLDKQDEFNSQVQEAFQGNQLTEQEQLEALTQASDEELAEIGLTRAEVNSAVAEATKGGEPNAEVETEGEQAPAMAGAEGSGIATSAPGAASPGVAAGVSMSNLAKRVIQLEKRDAAKELKAKQDAEEIELKAIEEKALKLASQRDAAIKENVELKARNEALELAVRTGTRPVKAGVDTGVRMFSANGNGELHPFQLRVKQIMEADKKTNAQAIMFASKENPALHADWVQSQRKTVTV